MYFDRSEMVHLAKAIAFIQAVGIPVRIVDRAFGFADKVKIENGCLLTERDAAVSTLLHEAGHLAVLPGQFRDIADGDLSNLTEVLDRVVCQEPPDSPLTRAILQAGDAEATAWAWAAGKHLGLPESSIISDAEYEGDAAGVRHALTANAWLGINGLAHAGMTTPRHCDGPKFPSLVRWVQPSIAPQQDTAPAIPVPSGKATGRRMATA